MFNDLKFAHILLIAAFVIATVATVLFIVATRGKSKD
jgi:hypothetical protein